MSMMARFIGVAPERLEEMRKSPERVEALFVAHVQRAPLQLSPALQARFRSQAPEVLRASLDRLPPELRAPLLRKFGISESDLARPDLGKIVAKRAAEHFARLHPQAQKAGDRASNHISLDKAWHGLHYLLCGAAEPAPGPLGQAVFGGEEIGDDMGYGPARYFTVAKTSEIAQALQALGESTLRGRFDPDAMEQLGLYPGGWQHEGPDWLIDAFRKLRDFYAAASADGQAVVTAIE